MRKPTRKRHDVHTETSQRVEALSASFHYRRDVLSNGLRVVTVEMPHLRSAMLAVYIRTGSRHESPDNNGVSHFLEHMFFRGSQHHPDTVQMNAAVEAAGGNLNGVTTRDHGYYFTPIHPKHVDVGVRILGDMLIRPRMTHMNVEREIILEEMLDEVDENGRDVDLDNLSKMQLFPNHPLALKIAGTVDSVKSLTKTQLLDHFRRHYVAGNLVFAATGGISRDHILEQVERHFRDLPPGPSNAEWAPDEGPVGPTFHHTLHDESQTEFRMSFKIVPEHHPDFAALQLLRRVLDDGLSSRLPYNVVEKRGLAYDLHAAIEVFHDVGLFEIDAATTPNKAAKVLEETCRTLEDICEQGVTTSELKRAQQRHRMSLEFSQDAPGDMAGWFGGTELFRAPETFEARCEALEQVTRNEMKRIARKYFNRKNFHVTAVGPKQGIRALAQAAKRAAGLPP